MKDKTPPTKVVTYKIKTDRLQVAERARQIADALDQFVGDYVADALEIHNEKNTEKARKKATEKASKL